MLEKYAFDATKDEYGSAAYMITKKWGFPWTALPHLVVGEPDLETFYVSIASHIVSLPLQQIVLNFMKYWYLSK